MSGGGGDDAKSGCVKECEECEAPSGHCQLHFYDLNIHRQIEDRKEYKIVVNYW